MTTCADLIQTTKNRYLLSGGNEQRNRLSADYTAGATTLAFRYPLAGIQAGATLSIGLNTFYVWSVDSAGNTANVSGGEHGSEDIDALTGDIVTVNPQWSNFDIFNALNEDLLALSSPYSGLFQMKQTEFPYDASRVGFDLAGVTDLLSIYEVRYATNDQSRQSPRIDNGMWRLERNYLDTENSSTMSLKLLSGAMQNQPVTVLYKSRFDPFNDFTDDVTVTGLPESAMDIPSMGAAIRLGIGREIRRNDLSAQGDTRRAAEVGPGAVAASYRGLQGMYQQRIMQEASRLSAAYPPRA